MLNHPPRGEGKPHIPLLSLEQSPQLSFLPGGDQHQGGTQLSFSLLLGAAGSRTRTWDTDTAWGFAALRAHGASVSLLPSPRVLSRALEPQCPKAFTEPHKQRAIKVHCWERSPKSHLLGSQHMHSLLFPKKLKLRRKSQQARGAEAGRPQTNPSAAQALQPCMHSTPAPSLLAPFDLTMPKKVLLCF